MKIGLAGVPGSGKTELANALATKLSKDNTDTFIIDDYVEEISKESNLALSFDAAYVGNIHIVLGRAARERIAYEKHENVITCGTLFETSSYSAQSLEVDYGFLTTDEQKYDFARRSEATMRIMACFYMDLIKYDHIFHLSPLGLSKDENIGKLEKNLQSAFQAFNLFEHTFLPIEGTTNDEITQNRLKKVLEVISADNS